MKRYPVSDTQKPRTHYPCIFLTGYGPSTIHQLLNTYKMNSMRDVNHIAKFNGQNFPLWKLGFWILLQQHDLVKVVTGEERVPTEVHSNIYLT